MSIGLLVALIVTGSLVFAGAIVAFVFAAVRRSRGRAPADLHVEGVVLDSGNAPVRITFTGFRGPRVYEGAGLRTGTGRVVLTADRLLITSLPHAKYGVGSLGREALAHCSVAAEDGALHLHAENVPGTKGIMDLRVTVADPPSWVAALIQAGATPLRG